MTSDEEARRGWRRPVVLACAALLVVAAGAAAVLARWQRSEAGGAPTGYVCVFFGGLDDAPDRDCGTPAGLDQNRTPVTDRQRLAVADAARLVRRAASGADWCSTPTAPDCARRPETHAPTAADVGAARIALGRTDASATTARLARSGDPGSVGALLYAARVGDVCVIGYLREVPGGGGGEEIVGVLPDGRCLRD